jgi:macrolide transport system ATP-binding/permease protein
MVLRRAALLVASGLALGMAGAYTGGRLMESMLHGLGGRNPILLAAAVAVVLSAAGLAAYLPARRAASVDPMEALRSE